MGLGLQSHHEMNLSNSPPPIPLGSILERSPHLFIFNLKGKSPNPCSFPVIGVWLNSPCLSMPTQHRLERQKTLNSAKTKKARPAWNIPKKKKLPREVKASGARLLGGSSDLDFGHRRCRILHDQTVVLCDWFYEQISGTSYTKGDFRASV